jgi:hypothetical protein
VATQFLANRSDSTPFRASPPEPHPRKSHSPSTTHCKAVCERRTGRPAISQLGRFRARSSILSRAAEVKRQSTSAPPATVELCERRTGRPAIFQLGRFRARSSIDSRRSSKQTLSDRTQFHPLRAPYRPTSNQFQLGRFRARSSTTPHLPAIHGIAFSHRSQLGISASAILVSTGNQLHPGHFLARSSFEFSCRRHAKTQTPVAGIRHQEEPVPSLASAVPAIQQSISAGTLSGTLKHDTTQHSRLSA